MEDKTVDTIPGKPGWEWHLDYSGRFKYLLLDGDEEFVEMMLAGLDKFGWTVDRYARSFRPASDGHHYDWYLRIPNTSQGYPGPDDVAIIVMREMLLRTTPQSVRQSPDSDRIISELRSELSDRDTRIAEAEVKLDQINKRVTKVGAEARKALLERESIVKRQAEEMRSMEDQFDRQNRLEAARQQANHKTNQRVSELSDELFRAAESYKKLLDENTKLRTDLQSGEDEELPEFQSVQRRVAELDVALIAAEKRVSDITKLRDEAQVENAELDSKVTELESEAAGLKADNRAAQLLLDEYVENEGEQVNSDRTPSTSSMDDFQQKTEAVLLALAPRIIFARDSLACLFSFVPNWKPVIDAVTALQAKKTPERSKRFQVGPGWFEIQFRTGRRANDGRLYYRKRRDADRLDVLVSLKRRQERDKVYLKTL